MAANIGRLGARLDLDLQPLPGQHLPVLSRLGEFSFKINPEVRILPARDPEWGSSISVSIARSPILPMRWLPFRVSIVSLHKAPRAAPW